jgi:hypothetical protein
MNPLQALRVDRRVLRLVPLALIALVSACDSGTVVVHDTIPPPPPPPVWWEGEPNDTAWLAPWFGGLFAGDSVYVEGYSTDDGSDPQDGLAFTAFGPMRIDFTLWVDDPWTDLDVWLYDPATGEFLYAFNAAYGDETGTFWMSDARDFHLVVVPSYGASNWTLGVWASGSSYASPLQAELPPLPPALEGYVDPDLVQEARADPEAPAGRARMAPAPR